MTPKEKAKQLVDRYKNLCPHPTEIYLDTDEAKLCAVITVDELIGSYAAYSGMYDQEFFDSERNYWQQVRTEIENL